MKMCFKHPISDYVEETSLQWLWTLLFGPLYFAVKGVWSHALLHLVLSLLIFGLPWLIYPFFASDIIYRHYMAHGWRHVTCAK